MDELSEQWQAAIEREKIALEREKLRLSYKKAIWIGVYAAVAIALVPASFQFASSILIRSQEKSQAASEELKFRSQYLAAFIDNALNQDIEIRLRLAEYFKYLAGDAVQRTDWAKYHEALLLRKNAIQERINELSKESAIIGQSPSNQDEAYHMASIQRELQWLSAETGYVSPEPKFASEVSRLPAVPPEDAASAQAIVEIFNKRGFGLPQQHAALAIAWYEANFVADVQEGSIRIRSNGILGFGNFLRPQTSSLKNYVDRIAGINDFVDILKQNTRFQQAEDARSAFSAIAEMHGWTVEDTLRQTALEKCLDYIDVDMRTPFQQAMLR